MNETYILIETRLYENGRMRIERKLNASGEWDEQIFNNNITKEEEKTKKPLIFKNKTIIGFQSNNFHFKDKYDAFGRIVKMKYYENNILNQYIEFRYNSPFTKTKYDQYVSYNIPRKVEYSMKIEYNPDGEKIQEKCYYPNRDLAWYADYKYNIYGRISEVLTYNNENLLIFSKITSYNSYGEKIKKEKFVHKDLINQWKSNSEKIGFFLWTTI